MFILNKIRRGANKTYELHYGLLHNYDGMRMRKKLYKLYHTSSFKKDVNFLMTMLQWLLWLRSCFSSIF